MFGFIIKKNFCDGWDNLLSVVVTNLIFLFVGFGLVYLNLYAMRVHLYLIYVSFPITCIIFSILVFAFGDLAAKIANFEGIHLLDYFKNIPKVLKDATIFGFLLSLFIMLSIFCFRFYFIQNKSIPYAFVGAIILWVDIFVLLSLQWFIPFRSLMKNDLKKCLKKSFIVFFDNTGFTIMMALYNFVLFLLSIFFIGLIPSMSGILISCTNALRLRLYKYDYLEEHPELKTKKERKNIPWEELIYEDRETLGPRTFRSFLFPWKDGQNLQE